MGEDNKENSFSPYLSYNSENKCNFEAFGAFLKLLISIWKIKTTGIAREIVQRNLCDRAIQWWYLLEFKKDQDGVIWCNYEII